MPGRLCGGVLLGGQYRWRVLLYDGNSGGGTHPAGEKKDNMSGLYDMSGNVWEWCNDWYGVYDTIHTLDAEGPEKGVERVIRGGSWMSHAASQRSANRASGLPLYRSKDMGFRTVLTIAEKG